MAVAADRDAGREQDEDTWLFDDCVERQLFDDCVERQRSRPQGRELPPRWQPGRWIRGAAGAILLAVAGVAALSAACSQTTAQVQESESLYGGLPWLRQRLLTVLHIRGAAAAGPSATQCGWTEEGVSYPGNDLRGVANVSSSGACCQACVGEPACVAWTWGSGGAGPDAYVCRLKGARPRVAVTRLREAAFVSGQPVQLGRSLRVREAAPGASLFCFSLVRPTGYESSLLALQYDLGLGVFGCDEYSILSNRLLTPAPGVRSSIVDSDLVCSMGGEFGTALNTDIFLKVWDSVIGEGRFRLHDWTAKVDPDAVFLPRRLREIAAAHPDVDGSGVYLNNCRHGLHGPLEVLSRGAVLRWAAGRARCERHFRSLCGGHDCDWGEDMFLDQCLLRVLNVSRAFDPRLLVEDHCDPPPDWRACSAGAAAFHPFKSADGYLACAERMLQQADEAVALPA